jgi:hypothetical protein
VIGFGFSLVAISITWLSIEMTPHTPIWRLVAPLTVTGIGMAFIWSPLAATATRNLPPQLAGAGSGVYNTTRQIGSVLGSAGLAAFMTWQISDHMPQAAAGESTGGGAAAQLPAFLQGPFSAAMSQTLLLPAFFALLGVGAALFFLGFGAARSTAFDDATGSQDRGYADGYADEDGFAVDHDEYVEYTVSWDDAAPVTARPADAEPDTEPLASRAPQVLHAPADVWHDEPVESWRHVVEDERMPEPLSLAHNGFHVDDEQRFQPLNRQPPIDEPPGRHRVGGEYERSSRHRLREDEPEARPFWFESSGRHSRDDPDESSGHGRHSTPWGD